MLRADKLYDVEKCEPWERQLKSCRRQKKFAEAEKIEKLLVEHRQDVWIKNWLKREFIPAEDREKAAQYACQMYKGRESYNEVWSNVVGAFDRQVLVPFCRMTDSTVAKIKQFEAERPFYKEVDKLFKKHMPDKHKFLGDIFKNVVRPPIQPLGYGLHHDHSQQQLPGRLPPRWQQLPWGYRCSHDNQ